MANAVYPSALDSIAAADIDLLADDIRVIIVDLADYTYSSAHNFLDDVPAAARVAVSGALTGKTSVGGLFDATDPVISGVTGDPSEAVIVYKHTGVDATANLICFIDTESDGSTPITFTPNGGDATVTFPNGILQL